MNIITKSNNLFKNDHYLLTFTKKPAKRVFNYLFSLLSGTSISIDL